ncbi:putative methylesterase 13, chloroplastic [Morella rubra]|uniref:Putative methylesterase 13, chloroplastic n=1 Tax=Morella rubra TaxID=262757 RepID=A0A6A1V6H7_9ROSI|nr:putative methylesterase 13, chloroplastic [Morella rubra]
MGNSWACFAPEVKEVTLTRKTSKRLPNSSRKSRTSTSTPTMDIGMLNDDAFIQQQALAAALLFRQHQQNLSLPLARSTSVVYPSPGPKRLPKSSSSRQRSSSDSLIQTYQLVKQDVKVDGLETNHFVLVHGGGFGAWCWYKIITLLEEGGFIVDAVDLTGSGIHCFDTNSIASLAQYVKPLTDILEKLEDGEKVILVGHDFGGACISYAMELFPSKISKAIFVAAAMLRSEQSTLDMFSQQAASNDLMRQTQIFLYANGKDQPPTAIDLDKALVKDLLFNQSPAKMGFKVLVSVPHEASVVIHVQDVALAVVSMRPTPFAPVKEKLVLSNMNYGSVGRFYVGTQEDSAIPVSLQEDMIKSNPPQQVFWLKGSDHAPFFSRPQSLYKILVEIAQIPSEKV